MLTTLAEVHQAAGTPTVNHHYPTMITLPDELSDEAVAQLLECLYQVTQALESQYAGQLRRYYNRPDERQANLWPETDPPF